MDLCEVCRELETNEMVQCDKCEHWFHYECVPITSDQVDKVAKFYCNQCEQGHKLITTWKVSKPDAAKRLEKRLHYHEIEEIVGHKEVHRRGRTIRQFKIKWKNYSQRYNEWVEETGLDGCLNLLQ